MEYQERGQSAVGDQYFLGIDGGATRCRARLRALSGIMLAESGGAAANIYVDYAGALAAVRSAISQALGRAGLRLEDSGRVAVGLGLAGLSTGAEAARIIGDLSGYARVSAANDAVTALLGAHAGADGGIVVAGTGSVGMARVAGEERVIGGRGFLLGDDGSAARIGADAIRAALRAFDGLGRSTPLTRSVMLRFADDPNAALKWALTAKPSDYGAFAPLVLGAAGEGDAVALTIVATAASALAKLTHAVRSLGAKDVALVGGLGDAIYPHLPVDLRAILRQPLFDAVDGAILLAGGTLPPPAAASRSAGS
jgi:glucosamine kinase